MSRKKSGDDFFFFLEKGRTSRKGTEKHSSAPSSSLSAARIDLAERLL
jgi:hypothetical protein